MVATRHGEGRAEANDDVKQHAPASRTAAVKRTTQQARARRRAQGRHQEQEQLDSSSEGLSSGEEGLSDDEGSLMDQASPEAASAGELEEEEEDADEAAATGGRSARAGRSLRDTIKKPPPSHVIQTFTRQPTPPKHLSRSERRQQQRDRERQQRQQEAELQELAAQRQELQQALRAAAGGYHLTRHQTRLLKQWSEDAPGVDPDLVAAAAGGDEEAAAALAAAAAEAAVDGMQSSEGDDDEEGGGSEDEGEEAVSSEEADQEADGDSDGADDGQQADQEQGDGEEAAGQDEAAGGPPTAAEAAGRASNRRTRQQSQPAVGRGAARGLKGELLRLKQAAAEAKASERRRRQREAMRQAARQQRLLAEQRGLRGSRRSSLEDVVLEYSSAEEEGLLQGSSSQEEAGRGHTRRAGRHLRKRRRAAWPQGSEDDDGDAGEEDEDDAGGGGRRKYKLRSRDNRVNIDLMHTEQPRQTARPKPKSGDQRRPQIKTNRSRRRGGFSELSSDDPGDEGAFLSGHWSRLLATAAGPVGPFYASAGLPPTPAAAAVAAAATAAAANGMLSPRASLDRRGSAFLDAAVAPGTASRVVGSGWGHWGAAGGAGEAGGAGGSGGGGAAAAAAGGTAAEKRGAGLGQELITPLQVDPSIDFDQIGGLDQYLSALKEMVFLPLLYPEIFDKFGVTPPRGVLFHGPPGTGKTLVARALAAQASKAAGQKVSFYMRKGADLLSKWVGEAEKQLRLLFEEASKHQPAIIFFDEIDGLAPVRTSKQDQVHNSIVSTLLALMDGLDSRGRVVLIGATNRPDALDPALRRPGRFDRELLFPMPDLAARRSILAIHSRHWQPQPPPKLLDDLAQQTGGYCGADLRALCAEASLAALRRVYPQIYASDVKLLIDPSAVHVTQQDFISAMKDLTPAAHRATASHAKALNSVIQPCLAQPLSSALSQVRQIFPPAAACMAQAAAAGSNSSSISHGQPHGLAKIGVAGSVNGSGSGSSRQVLQMARPRLLLVGPQGSGQQQLGAAVLAALEGLPVHCIGLTSLLANVAARCVEEALVSAFTEARRSAPAIIYWPQAHLWWAAAGSGLRCALVALLDDLPADLPLLLLATAELPDADAAAAGTAGSSRRLLPGPSSTVAAAAAGRASTAASGQEQPGECLEELGLDPTLAALFPPVGCLSDLQGLILWQTAQQDTDLPHAQQNPQAGMVDPQQQRQLEQHCSQGEAAAGHGRGVLGWVLLQPPGPLERRKMFQGILDAAAAPPVPEDTGQGQQQPAPLPPAPDAAAAAEAQRKAAEAAAARVAYEEDQAVLRSLRMILRGIVQRALTLKRYRLFAEPPMLDDEEGIQALQCLSSPMDLLTMLYKVDHQEYITPAAFLADAHLIVRCAEELYGHPEEATGTGFASATAQHAGTSAAAAAAGAAAGEGAVGDDAEAAAADATAGAAGPDHVEAGNGPGQQAEDTGQAAAAGATAGAAAAGPQVQQVPPLPAVRVAVCKEISRATELKDGLEQQVYQLVPPDLAQACEAIAAKGGPAAPPPGMLLPQQLLAAKLPSLAAARGAAADAAASGKPTRTTARLTGRKLDRRLLHADPEALMRARKQSKAKTAAQQAAAAAEPATDDPTQQPPSQQQQQQQEQKQEEQTQQADVDVEMAEAAGDAADAAAAAAATTSAAVDQGAAAATATAADAEPQQQEQQQQQQPTEEEPPAALKPVTNGVSRKRRAPSADDSADGDGGRVAKAARHSVGIEQQVFGSAAGNSSDGVPVQQQQQQEAGTGGEAGQQQLDVGPQLPQPHNKQQQDSLPHGPELQQATQQPSDGSGLLPLQPLQEPAAPAAAAADLAAAGQLLDRVVQATAGMQLSALELLHARLSRVVAANAHQEDRSALLQQLAHIITGLEQAVQ